MATVTLAPAGAGAETNIVTLVGAATHWQAELTNDGDTSYVGSLVAVTERDLYTIDANSIPAGSTINSVTVYVVSKYISSK